MAILENASRANSTQQPETSASPDHEGVGMAAPAFQLDASAADTNGLHPGLKYGVERESGFDLGAVRVHRGSSLPAKFGALAIAKGLEVFLSPGQEDKLPHEVWHLVQQWRGLVKPTHYIAGQAVNKDPRLEAEANTMGEKANQKQPQALDRKQLRQPNPVDIVQRLAVQISLANSTSEKVEDEKEETEKLDMKDEDFLDIIDEKIVESKMEEVSDKKSPIEEKEIDKPREINESSVKGVEIIKNATATISDIKIVGRPPKLFGNSMGDHTTAYSVHQKGIMVALKGQTLAEAVKILGTQYDESLKLPGMAEKAIERSGRGMKLLTLQMELGDYKSNLLNAIKDQSPRAVLLLQRMIAKYLEFREEIPFAAMNIAAISFGLAGKGKAEAGFVDILVKHETGELTAKENVLQEAIIALLDTEGLAVMISEPNEEVRKQVLPGIDTSKSPEENLGAVLDQHMQTMKISFPKSFNDSKLKNEESTRKELIKSKIGPKIIGRIDKESLRIGNSIKHTNERITKLTDNDYRKAEKRTPKIPPKFKGYPYVLHKHTTAFLDRKAEVNDEISFLDTLTSESNYLDTLGKSDFLNEVKAESTDKTKEERSNKLDLKSQRSAAKKLRKKEAENSELAERNEGIATELILAKDNDTVMDIESAGRTESPFGSSVGMGAHSTAWVVHVDEVRAKLRGKMIEKAILEMHKMVDENKEKRKTMESLKIKIEQTHLDKLNRAEKDFDAYKDLEKKDKSLWVTELQSYINALLAYINFIPGSTFNSVNTNGRGEGASRAVLLEYENGKVLKEEIEFIANDDSLDAKAKQKAAVELAASTRKEVKDSIDGLLDLSEVKGGKVCEQLTTNHMNSIKIAYPRSYKLYYDSTSLVEELKKEAKKRKTRDKDFGTFAFETTEIISPPKKKVKEDDDEDL